MTSSHAEAAIILATINAEAHEVAAEHCTYLMRQGLSTAEALHLIGRKGHHGWGGVISTYATAWRAMQRRNVLREGLT